MGLCAVSAAAAPLQRDGQKEPPAMQRFYTAFAGEAEQLLAEYFKILRYRTIAVDPCCAGQLDECAQWLADVLRKAGFSVEVWRRDVSPPIIFASAFAARAGAPTVLLYGHYDVQPVDPLELWESPPFEPEIRGGAVYARGAQDNKGQLMYTLAAVRWMLAQPEGLPVNVKICIEGQEEIGSEALQKVSAEKSEKLRADYLVIVDSSLRARGRPCVSLGSRGSTLLSVEFTGSRSDLHSGVHGGLAYNPNRALVEVLSKLYDPSGRVAVPGFYDDVSTPDPAELKALDLAFDCGAYQAEFGVGRLGGEIGCTPVEANLLRPTLEINGVCGGYAGEGVKMVIPAAASAKLSARLVPDQDPDKIAAAVSRFIHDNTPAGIGVDIWIGPGGKAVRSSPRCRLAQAAAQAYSEVFGAPCSFVLDGFTIPPAAVLCAAAGAEVILIGHGLPSDNIHAPNEHFELSRMRDGFATMCRFLQLCAADV